MELIPVAVRCAEPGCGDSADYFARSHQRGLEMAEESGWTIVTSGDPPTHTAFCRRHRPRERT